MHPLHFSTNHNSISDPLSMYTHQVAHATTATVQVEVHACPLRVHTSASASGTHILTTVHRIVAFVHN